MYLQRGLLIPAIAAIAAAIIPAADCQHSQPDKSTPTTIPQRKSGAVQKYRELTKDDGPSCSFSQDLSISMGSPFSGSASASANHFTCLDKAGKEVEIALISRDPNVNAVPKGGKIGIRTKLFGTFYRGNEDETFDKYEMTDIQIRQLRAFLGLSKAPTPTAQPRMAQH